VGQMPIELADFHGRSRERSFQRPFGESREVPRGEIDPRTESERRSKESNQERAQPPAKTVWCGPSPDISHFGGPFC
jgi:hypothetical protein